MTPEFFVLSSWKDGDTIDPCREGCRPTEAVGGRWGRSV